MRKLDKLLLSSYIGPFLMSFAIILFILVLQIMSLYMDDIFGKGLSVWVILKLFMYAGGRLAVTAMPIAILAGALMTFGSLGEHYELAAIKSCGISVFKVMRPLLILSFFLMAFSLWFSFDVIPRANLKFFSLFYDIQRKKPDVAIKPGYFYKDIDDFAIRVSDKDLETGRLFDVLIYDHSEKRGAVNVIKSDSARTFMESGGNIMRMVLYSGTRYQEYKPDQGKPESHRHGRTYFDSLYYKFDLSGFDLERTDEKQFRHQIILRMPQLRDAIDSIEAMQVEHMVKYTNQLGRYTKVDSTFMASFLAAADTLYLSQEDRQLIQEREEDEESYVKSEGELAADALSASPSSSRVGAASMDSLEKTLSELEDSDTALLAMLIRDSTLLQDTDTALIQYAVILSEKRADSLRQDSLAKEKARRKYPRDFTPLDIQDYSLLDCYEEVGHTELLNKALVDARAVKSYIEFMVSKKEDDGKAWRKHIYEWYSRIAIPINCVLFMLIGASLGAIIRKGGLGMPSLISILLFLAFYVLITQGKKLAKEGVMHPIDGAFLPVYVFAPLAIYVTYQATTDSRLLDESSWGMLRDRIYLFRVYLVEQWKHFMHKFRK